MSVNGIGTAYSKWMGTVKTQKNSAGINFAEKMDGLGTAESLSFPESSVKTAGQSSILAIYRALASSGIHNANPDYETYESENYRIVPDNEARYFDIYNKQGEKLGAFAYSDIKVRQDSTTGKQLLISESGTMWYDALVLDGELKNALQNVMGVNSLETEELQGYTLKTHSGTGIQYLLRDGEEGRGGKILLQSELDIKRYEALAETYCQKYPNLVKDKNAGYFWASNEIRGLAAQSGGGILSIHYDGMSYNHDSDYKKNWSVRFSGDIYSYLYEWLQKNSGRMEEMQNFSVWDKFFADRGMQYERIWSKEEELQGYLNN